MGNRKSEIGNGERGTGGRRPGSRKSRTPASGPSPAARPDPDPWAAPLQALERLYAELGRGTGRLDRAHAGRLRCGPGCSKCCLDGLTVFEIEAERIRRRNSALLAAEAPAPAGACAFLDGRGACRIYPDRPYVCRTQGYPLRWIEEREDGSAAELRDVCPENEGGIPVVGLPEDECWTIGPFEGELAALQRRASGGKMTRATLRGLFSRRAGMEGLPIS